MPFFGGIRQFRSLDLGEKIVHVAAGVPGFIFGIPFIPFRAGLQSFLQPGHDLHIFNEP